jgi:hypothetical protein
LKPPEFAIVLVDLLLQDALMAECAPPVLQSVCRVVLGGIEIPLASAGVCTFQLKLAGVESLLPDVSSALTSNV